MGIVVETEQHLSWFRVHQLESLKKTMWAFKKEKCEPGRRNKLTRTSFGGREVVEG